MSTESKTGLKKAKNSGGAAKFGTFGGVFTPSILTILSAILFMRANFVVGEAGVYGALLILVVANLVSIFSAISVCGISTNTKVKGGGAYFLISRALGPEYGGAIGIVFFFALALNVTFNILGFTEALKATIPQAAPYSLYIALGAAGLLFVIAFLGAGLAIRTQYVIMAFLAVSIAVMWAGTALRFDPALFTSQLGSHFTAIAGPDGPGPNYNFWLVFAIFFPSVTGFLAGVNMSGDLKDAMRSIPKGTFLAVIAGALIYLITMLLGAGAFSRADLIERPFAVLKESAPFGLGILVAAGVFAATLSTALGSYLGAPRVLQAVARDRLLPVLTPFGRGQGAGDEPRNALWLTGLIAVGVLLWAELKAGPAAFNIVAGLISMVFLATYGMINLAAFIEGFSGNPSFRPRFKLFHWLPALLGFLGCTAVGFLINPGLAVGSITIVLVFYFYLKHRELKVTYGDARRGYYFQRARNYLVKLSEAPEDLKNWRPTILAFSASLAIEKLATFAVWLEAGRGFVLLAHVHKRDADQAPDLSMRLKTQMLASCRKENIQAFSVTLVDDDVPGGIRSILQTASIGPVRPNIALFGWNSDTGTLDNFISILGHAQAARMSIVLITHDEEPVGEKYRQIDIWWRGRKNGDLMLILTLLLSRNWEWARSRIRLLRVVPTEEGRQSSQAALEDLLTETRIPIQAQVIVSQSPFAEILKRHSAKADCVVLGFEVPDPGSALAWHGQYEEFQRDMPTLILVCAIDDNLLGD